MPFCFEQTFTFGVGVDASSTRKGTNTDGQMRASVPTMALFVQSEKFFLFHGFFLSQ